MNFVTVNQVPASSPGAFVWPVLPTPKATTGGLVRTIRYPNPVPVEAPAALVPISQIPDTQGSNSTRTWDAGPAGYTGVNRNQMTPGVYVAHADNMHAPMAAFSDNELPVPTQPVTRLSNAKSHQMRQGGQGQVPWRRAYPSFPNYTSMGYISQVGYQQ